MQADRTTVAHNIATSRSIVSNGTRLLQNVDGRSSAARRFRDLVRSYSEDLGGALSEAERSLVRQAVALQIQSERMQEQIVRGEAVNSDELIRISSTSKRLLQIIASKAGSRKPAGDTLDEYLDASADSVAS